MTLLQITNTIKSISLAQPNIHSFVDEFIDLNSSDAKYSAIVLQQRNHQRNNDFIQFNFYLGMGDRLTENKDNEIEVQSTAIQVIDNIVYALENHNLDCTIGSYSVFTERFLALVAGAYTELSINIPASQCEDDFSKEELNVNIVANGEYNYIPTGLGFSSVHLNVDVAKLQDKALNITKNGQYNVRFDKGYSGLGNVDVNVDVDTQSYYDQGYSAGKTEGKAEGIQQQKSKLVDLEITENNTEYSREDGYKNVSVNIDETPVYNEGYDKGKTDGITEGQEIQKSKLVDLEITENNTEYSREDGYKNVSVNIDETPVYNEGYDKGKTEGKAEGIAEQKSKLTDITVTENGVYVTENGYKKVSVDIDETPAYDKGKTDGITEGQEIQKSKLVDLEITENNTEYSREDGYKKVSVNIDETPIYDRGYDKGKEEGYNTGFVKGTDYGYDRGYDKGKEEGYNTGFVKGTDYGYDRGYDKGKEEGTDEQKSKLTDITITENGTYNREDGYGKVTVAVTETEIKNQEKTITITSNGTSSVIPDTGYTGLSKVDVNVDVPSHEPVLRDLVVKGKKSLQVFTPTGYDGYSSVTVEPVDNTIDSNIKPENIKSGVDILGVEGSLEPVNNQNKSVSINSNGTSSVIPDTGYTGLNKVDITVDVPSDQKPETELSKTIAENGTHVFTPEEGTVYNKVNITADIHPTEKLKRTYMENNTYVIDGEYNGAEITVNVDTQDYYDQGYTAGKVEGKAEGKAEGIQQQKDKLTDITITENGTYTREDGYKSVVVNVDTVNNQEKTVSITSNGITSVVPDSGYTGLSKVDVNVDVDMPLDILLNLSVLGYTNDDNRRISAVLQPDVDYSESLLESYGVSQTYVDDTKLVYVPMFPTQDRESFGFLFAGCANIITVPTLDTSNGLYFDYMFSNCSALTSIPALDTSNGTDFSYMFRGCDALTSIPTLDTSKGTNFSYMFDSCDALTSVPALDTSEGTNFRSMFSNCEALTSIPALDLSKGEIFTTMFSNCEALTSVPELNTSNGIDFRYMFSNCSALTSVPALDTSEGREFDYMFSNCSALTSVPELNTSNGTNFYGMFLNCSALTSVPELDASNVTNFSSMFSGCSSLTSISLLNTSNVTIFSDMFYKCSALTSVPALDTSKGTMFTNMFLYCSALTSVPALDTSNGLNFNYMFGCCSALTSIPTLDTSNGLYFDYMFLVCKNLTDITFTGSINYSIDFKHCTKLTFDSIKSILTACSNTTNTDSKTVSFDRTIQDQNNELTDLVASCTEKGWTVSGLTISA